MSLIFLIHNPNVVGLSLNMCKYMAFNTGNVIIYSLKNGNDDRKSLGITNSIEDNDKYCEICRLGIREEESEENNEELILFIDEGYDNITSIHKNEILDVSDSNFYCLEQRAVRDRISNLHFKKNITSFGCHCYQDI